MDDRIRAAASRLIDFPNSGRPGRVAGTRELVVPGAPYILPYRIDGDAVRILRVIHAARLWPDEIPDEV
jgi:toxin ParE1/3/4